MTEIWIQKAKEIGFDEAGELNIATLKPVQMVREACVADKCGAYGRNWTSPPACGTLEDCEKKMASYRHGILLQTVGQMQKRIDIKAYIETEKRHMEFFLQFCEVIRKEYPNALCLGAGGCRLCPSCAYPKPCRFPDKATYSMEGYGLFVTQVCRDNGMKYYYGPKTIAYTACVLF